MSDCLFLRRRSFATFCLLSILIGSPRCAVAQNAQLTGVINDAASAVIPNASVEVLNQETQVKVAIRSNGSGIYTVPSLSPGSYRITVTAPGFETKVVDNFRAAVAGKFSLDFILQPSSIGQSVTVDAGGMQVNTTDAAVSTVIDRQFVENVPLNGRTLQSLVTAIPGVSAVPTFIGAGFSGEIAVNGQRSEGNYFTVDGVSANTGQSAASTIGYGSGFSGAVPGETVLGTTQSIVSLDALQEFRGVTSTYSAEYGRTSGGQFAFSTRSGTNHFHGSAYDYFRNGVFDANAYFNKYGRTSPLPKPKENQNDFGGTFGGPVLLPGYSGRDKTFFFVSYEGLQLRLPQAATPTLVPNATLRSTAAASIQPFLNTFPLPNGADAGDGLAYFSATYSTPSSIHATSFHIDHSINDRWKVFGRYSDTPSHTVGRYASNLAIETPADGRVKSLTGGLTTVLTPHMVNEFRTNSTWNDSFSTYRSTSFGGAAPLALTDLTGLDASGQVNFYILWKTPNPLLILKSQSSRQRQLNFVDTFSLTAGRHNFRFGADYRHLHNDLSLPSAWEIGFYNTQAQALNNAPGTGQVRRFFGKMEPVYQNLSLFAQDEWSALPRLTLSYGLRWELNPAPTDATGNLPYTITGNDPATAQLAPAGTSLWKTTFTNFAPRLGLAYEINPAEGKRTVLRAGWGLYYDLGSPVASSGYNGVGIAAIGSFNGLPMPFTPSQIDSVASASTAPPYSAAVFAFDPDLKLPRIMQWSAAVEQQLGRAQSLSVSYIGSRGDRMLVTRQYYPSRAGNTNFSNLWPLVLTTNGSSSNYNALQAQFHRTLSRGLQALLAYTWSHSIDDATSNYTVYQLQRASSDFDVRHNFQLSLTYDLPGHYRHAVLDALLGRWSIDSRVSARSALPVDITSSTSFDPATGQQVSYHPNLVANQPLYRYDPSLPGGRAINYSAFQSVSYEGNAGRNIARGFNAVQTDLAVHKNFVLREGTTLQFRAEAFNLLNHPTFGAIYNQLTTGSALFGQAYSTLNNQLGGLSSLYQMGGPRSLQLALKLQF